MFVYILDIFEQPKLVRTRTHMPAVNALKLSSTSLSSERNRNDNEYSFFVDGSLASDQSTCTEYEAR